MRLLTGAETPREFQARASACLFAAISPAGGSLALLIVREVAIMRLSFLVRATGRVRMRNVLAGARATTPIGPGLAERGKP
jgi:hypothetical protein